MTKEGQQLELGGEFGLTSPKKEVGMSIAGQPKIESVIIPENQLGFRADVLNTTRVVEKSVATSLTPEIDEEEKVKARKEIRQEILNLWIVDKNKIIRGPYKTGSPLVEININQKAILQKTAKKENPKRFEYRTREPLSGVGLKYRNKIEINQGEIIDPYGKQRIVREDEKPEIAERLYQNWLRIQRIKSKLLVREVSRPKES